MQQQESINLSPGKKIYFASDFHLGTPSYKGSIDREKKVIQWLDSIKGDCAELYLVGDVFDFWFEYKHVVPRGFIRLLGKLTEMADSGIKIHLFTGNHDMWIFDYLPDEIGTTLYREPVERTINGKQFYIGHGDGLGPGDHGYKFIKRVFSNKLCQWLFKWIHPDIGMALGEFWSQKSRKSVEEEEKAFLGEDKEWLVIHAKEELEKKHYDYFIFGHRHIPLDIKITDKTRYLNLGDWIFHFTYGVFDGERLELVKYEN